MPATLSDIQRKYGESVYPLYKDEMHAPYMENDSGIGYRGVVLYDNLEDKVQCAQCGEWFTHLGQHVLHKHKTKASEYRKEYGLFNSTPLCSPSVSQKRSKVATQVRKKYKTKFNDKEYQEKIRETRRQSQTIQQVSRPVAHDNKYGLCDAQIAARLIIVRDMAQKSSLDDVTNSDLLKYDKRLYEAISHRYGNRELACKALGIKHIAPKAYDDSFIIAKLRNYALKEGKMPRLQDIGIDHTTIYKHFGSWRRAKMMAGLDQLLELKTIEGSSSQGSWNDFNDEFFISSLRSYVLKNNRIPPRRGLVKAGLPSVGTYEKRFGSWKKAKEIADLDQLLEEVKSR